MLKLLLRACISGLRSRRRLALENLALRHQLEVLQRTAPRRRLRTADRALWVLLSRICRDWRRHLLVVRPDTVIRWHRLGWRLYWRRKSRTRLRGRPPAEAEVRALIRRLSAYDGGSLQDLEALADKIGLRSRKGRRLSKGMLSKILHNLTYTGNFKWAGVVYRGRHEPIIPRSLYDAVQERLAGRAFPQRRRHQFAFRGLLRCGVCGCLVTAERKQGKYVYYHCTHARGGCREGSVREERLAEMLGEPLKRLRLTQERLEWILEAVAERERQERQEGSQERRRLREEVGTLEVKLDRLYEDRLGGVIEEGFWRRKHSQLEARRAAAVERLEALEADSGGKLASTERILELTQKAYSLYLKQEPAEQRRLLNLLLSKSTLEGGVVTAELRQPFAEIADGAEEEAELVGGGAPISARNEIWLPRAHTNHAPAG